MAEVLARAIVDGVGLLCVSDPEEIDEIFGPGRDQVGDRCEPVSFALEEAIEYLQQKQGDISAHRQTTEGDHR